LLKRITGSPGWAATARFSAAPKPMFSPRRSSVTSPKRPATIASEPSLEALSTTTTSTSRVCARRLSSARARSSPPLKFGI
jgi:hypothetical protein